MKQTYNVNIGGHPYNIDSDAYELLDRYLNDIASRLSGADTDTMADIESRISEILGERITSDMQVVSVEQVRRAMAVIGRPDTFGGQKRGFAYQNADRGRGYGHSGGSASYPNEPRRLYRSVDNKVIGGVCAGVAEFFDLDPNVVRLLTVLFVFFGGLSLWVYIIMWIVLSKAPQYK